MKALKWASLTGIALLLTVTILAVFFIQWEPIVTKPEPLRDHPNAHWSGGVDGGAFFEITKAEPPHYFLEIRYENGNLWAKGWLNEQEQSLTNSDFLGYYGGETVELNSGKQLRLENQDGAPINVN